MYVDRSQMNQRSVLCFIITAFCQVAFSLQYTSLEKCSIL
jgi:hypothetical protein